MGRYVKTRIVTDGLIYLNDAANSKSYSGVGTAIKNLVGYGATNTSFNQTFVSSGTTSYFVSTGSTSYISNTNVSVSASTGRGFTICMMIKPQTLTNSEWNYWFQQQSSNSLIEFGRYGTFGGWEMKDSAKVEGQMEFTSVGTTTWTVPVGVTSVTAVCVGGGGGGSGHGGSDAAAGGGGGGLSYGTFSVTPGETLDIRVGAGGTGGTSSTGSGTNGFNGTSSYIKRGVTTLIEGGGGGGGTPAVYLNIDAVGGSGGTSTGTARSGGGSGGNGGNSSSSTTSGAGGGGGAGGYSSSGGSGGSGSSTPTSGTTSTSGGGGGGGAGTRLTSPAVTNPGGGVGIYRNASGPPEWGQGGSAGSSSLNPNPGGGGSGGTTGSGGNGGLYGGGGGSKRASISSVINGGNGGQGAVRIVWGNNRSYPSTNTSNPIPPRQSTSFSDWTFVVCGVTTNYYTFISTNGSTKSLGSSNDWNNSDQINFDKIFGTGTSNYSCLWNNCMIYNRELTNEEIQINFEAFRRKFNL